MLSNRCWWGSGFCDFIYDEQNRSIDGWYCEVNGSEESQIMHGWLEVDVELMQRGNMLN